MGRFGLRRQRDRERLRSRSGLGIVLGLLALYLLMAAVLAAVVTGLWWLLQAYV